MRMGHDRGHDRDHLIPKPDKRSKRLKVRRGTNPRYILIDRYVTERAFALKDGFDLGKTFMQMLSEKLDADAEIPKWFDDLPDEVWWIVAEADSKFVVRCFWEQIADAIVAELEAMARRVN